MKGDDTIILNLKCPYELELLVTCSCVFSNRTITKKIRYVPMYFSRLYSNFPRITHNDESLIRRTMVLPSCCRHATSRDSHILTEDVRFSPLMLIES